MRDIAYEIMKSNTTDFPIGVYKITNNPANDKTKPMYALHWHNDFEFVTVSQGAAYVVIDNQKYEIHKGESVFVNSGSIHTIFPSLTQEETVVFAVAVSPSFLACDCSDCIYKKYISPVLDNHVALPAFIGQDTPWERQINQLLTQIIRLLQNSEKQLKDSEHLSKKRLNVTDKEIFPESFDNGDELTIKSVLFSLWYTFWQHAESIAENNHRMSTYYISGIKEAILYINAHYNTEITLESLAALTHMSKESFTRVFKKYTVYQPFYYINLVRVYQSLEYLEDNEKNITEVAFLCGYQSVSYYNRKFKSIIGCSPSEYKKRLEQSKQLHTRVNP